MTESTNVAVQPQHGERTVLFDNGDFSYTAELSRVPLPVGGHCLTIRSNWRSAKNAAEDQIRLSLCLDDVGLASLAELVTGTAPDAEAANGGLS